MPLTKSKVELKFLTALQGDTDERLVPPGALLDAKNCYVDKKSAFAKRHGFTKVPKTKLSPKGYEITAGRKLFSTGEELCLASKTRLHALKDSTQDGWYDRGYISPCEVKVTGIEEDYGQVRTGRFDTAANDGFILTGYQKITSDPSASDALVSEIWYCIEDEDGQRVQGPTMLTNGSMAAPEGSFVRCCHCQGKLLLFYDTEVAPGVWGQCVAYWDTASIDSPPTLLIDVIKPPTLPATAAYVHQRIDAVGHDGSSAGGQFSTCHVSAKGTAPAGAGADLVIVRWSSTINVAPPHLIPSSITIFVGGGAPARMFYKASISDDAPNNKTLFAAAIETSGATPAGMINNIWAGQLDHAGGVLDWFVDTGNQSDSRNNIPGGAAGAAAVGINPLGYDKTYAEDGVSFAPTPDQWPYNYIYPRTLGVASGLDDYGNKIAVVAFDKTRTLMWVPCGNPLNNIAGGAVQNSSGNSCIRMPLDDVCFDSGADMNDEYPASKDYLAEGTSTLFCHRSYATTGPGCSGNIELGLATQKLHRIDQKYSMVVTTAMLQFTIGPAPEEQAGSIPRQGTKRNASALLISKPFAYDGRVYAWMATNMNVGYGYETTFLGDLQATTGLLAPASSSPAAHDVTPMTLAAVVDVGVALSGLMTRTYQFHGGQNVPRMSQTSNAFYCAYPRTETVTTYVHGEIVGGSGRAGVNDGFPNVSVRVAKTTFGKPVDATTLEDGAAAVTGGFLSWYAGTMTEELGFVGLPAFDHWASVALKAFYALDSTDGVGVPGAWNPSGLRKSWFDLAVGHYSMGPAMAPWPPSNTLTGSTIKCSYTAIWECYDEKGYLHRSSFVPFYEAPTLYPASQYPSGGGGSKQDSTQGTQYYNTLTHPLAPAFNFSGVGLFPTWAGPSQGWPDYQPFGAPSPNPAPVLTGCSLTGMEDTYVYTGSPAVAPYRPAVTTQNVSTGPDCHLLVTKTNGATNRWKRNVSVRYYRDLGLGNAVYSEVNLPMEDVLNETGYYNVFLDTGRDLTEYSEVEYVYVDPTADPAHNEFKYYDTKKTTPGGKSLYTTGGVIENVIPEAASFCAVVKDRLWLGGFASAERLQYSKRITPSTAQEQKIAPEFNEGFALASPGSEDFTAVSRLDDKVVAFTEDGVYVVAGNGPDATGARNDFSALTLVSGDTGCADFRSVVTTPVGVMFMGKSGIHVVNRGLGLSFIGDAARDITKLYPICTSATLVPKQTQVRFTLVNQESDAASTSGVILIYDYRVNQWFYWEVIDAGGQQVGFTSAALHNDVYYAMQPDGQVWKQESASWKDDATVSYPMVLKTAWLQAAKQSGWQRVYRAAALCEKKSNMSLTMAVETDFLPTSPQTVTWDNAILSSFPNTPVMQPLIHVKRQKCQAVRICISDSNPGGGTNEGFTIAGFTLEIGIKAGMVKVAKAQRN